jgi:hypothetical protein
MVWRGASGTGDGSSRSLHDFVGMDPHKKTIVAAMTAAGEVGKAASCGTHPNVFRRGKRTPLEG